MRCLVGAGLRGKGGVSLDMFNIMEGGRYSAQGAREECKDDELDEGGTRG